MSDIYLSLTETPAVVTLSQPVAATQVAATVTVGNTVTVALDANSLSALENVTVTVGSSVALAAGSAQVGSVTISNFPSTQTIAGTVTANLSQNFVSDDAGTIPNYAAAIGFGNESGDFSLVRHNAPLPISGTVTANVKGIWSGDSNLYDLPVLPAGEFGNGTRIPVSIVDNQGNTIGIGADGADRFLVDANITNTVTIGSLPTISGTVTANNPSGALTTRFGSVATANLAFITSAVTNTFRKYLLAQNISAGTVTIGIGFSPTTTQGIQLAAGGGLTFDAFCPTGAVYWLGAVTGAAFTILEG